MLERTGRTAPLSPEEFRRRRGDMYSAIDFIFVQNRVGLFELTCTYTSAQRGAWNGTVRSKPFYIRITDAGEWVEQVERMARELR